MAMFDGPLTPEPELRECRARIRLARGLEVGPVRFQEALAHFGSAHAACRQLPVASEADVAREEGALSAIDGRFLVWGDPDYPAQLATLPDAPPLLSAIGDVGLLARRCLALVGAREASAIGRRFAGELSADLGRAGFVVVSGLARGIDASAHRAALATGTVAVLAGGIDQIYPPQNHALHGEIAERGLLLSESPFGMPAVARAFPRRNRIVSGLSLGVVVVEAAEKSGSLITAQRALDQGREVFVVPGSPIDPRYGGSNSLIRDGAILARNVNDIISVFGVHHIAPQVIEKTPEKPISAIPSEVVRALGPTPTPVDEVVRRCQVSAASVADILLALELDGRLERHRGGLVSLI